MSHQRNQVLKEKLAILENEKILYLYYKQPASILSLPRSSPEVTYFTKTENISPLFSFLSGFKCPICSKSVASDEMEMHFIMCLSKPRLSYNDDVLTKDAGECVICLEELLQGDTIARLPCLCIYHKSCIDSWFEVNRSCPEHPAD
ncbi:E3 ubiquitin-protein ligase ZNRF1 [Erinaceus europaeus]|uniref:E3 ubiquitin-protein ligase ZNRF1 n=1 Tax=Erinaceus europaeus TaxID=9365 RepID=A0ABM3X0K4_ERIEU|nr:E3 ubiquitin-protein ligase ZNRF1 [Erinaceus europaeus]